MTSTTVPTGSIAFDTLTTLQKRQPSHPPQISSNGREMRITTEDNRNWYRTPTRSDSDGLVYGVSRKVSSTGFEISVDLEIAVRDQVSRIARCADGSCTSHAGVS